jgi:hypothetical protein
VVSRKYEETKRQIPFTKKIKIKPKETLFNIKRSFFIKTSSKTGLTIQAVNPVVIETIPTQKAATASLCQYGLTKINNLL